MILALTFFNHFFTTSDLSLTRAREAHPLPGSTCVCGLGWWRACRFIISPAEQYGLSGRWAVVNKCTHNVFMVLIDECICRCRIAVVLPGIKDITSKVCGEDKGENLFWLLDLLVLCLVLKKKWGNAHVLTHCFCQTTNVDQGCRAFNWARTCSSGESFGYR